MTRLSNWQSLLTAYIGQVGAMPFEEGTNDCALFLAGGVMAMTGQDFAAEYRGSYTTIRGGLRMLRKRGFEDHIALAKHHLAEKPIAFAQAGDGAVIDTPEGAALGIVQGHLVYVLREDGLAYLPLTQARMALEV